MIHVFLDSNVILDLLMNRGPFAHESRLIFELAEKEKIRLYTSALSMANIHYIISKEWSVDLAHQAIGRVRKLVSITAVTEAMLDECIRRRHKDFEDAIQFHSAKESCEVIVTRDLKGFSAFRFPCLTPSGFLDKYFG